MYTFNLIFALFFKCFFQKQFSKQIRFLDQTFGLELWAGSASLVSGLGWVAPEGGLEHGTGSAPISRSR